MGKWLRGGVPAWDEDRSLGLAAFGAEQVHAQGLSAHFERCARIPWVQGRDRQEAHLEIFQRCRQVNLHIRNGDIHIDLAAASHIHVLRSKRSRDPPDT
jgi:hypothetical protein